MLFSWWKDRRLPHAATAAAVLTYQCPGSRLQLELQLNSFHEIRFARQYQVIARFYTNNFGKYYILSFSVK